MPTNSPNVTAKTSVAAQSSTSRQGIRERRGAARGAATSRTGLLGEATVSPSWGGAMPSAWRYRGQAYQKPPVQIRSA